ncbi:hypothetical protein AVEN_99129-1, partial [Araneus ventricosus]
MKIKRTTFESASPCHSFTQDPCGLVVRSRIRVWRVPGSKPDSTEDPPLMWACLYVKYEVMGQTLVWCESLDVGASS